jgi:carotenoid cleavage dioxygenase
MNKESSNPFLAGNFAPALDELDCSDLEIIGEIPAELSGIYMRNGPNPQFPPQSYTYPYDGDGMIHAIYIADGKAAYRNRFVQTKALLKERQAGKALYGGVLQPLPMEPQWAEPEDEPVAFKNGAFIHVIRHGNDYLALSESFPAYRINRELDTLGEWVPYTNQAPINLCAHTRLDPVSGELWCINYALMPPYLTVYRFDKEGKPLQKWDIDKPHSSMIHDFVLTQHYVIIFDCPVIFDIQQMMTGGEVLGWRPELGSRIGVLSRADGHIRWFATDPFFVFHFANAYEQGPELIIEYIRHEKIVLLTGDSARGTPPMFYRTRVHLEQNTVSHSQLDDRMVEFPRIREDRNSLMHRYVYTPTKTADNKNPRTFNALIKYDVLQQRSEVHEFGSTAEIGEAVFAPAKTQEGEDDGFLLLFVYDSLNKQSECVILDARQITQEPLARIKMPRRIPHGLHGSWLAAL